MSDSELGPPCPLCGRPLIPGPSVNRHHLVPKTYGGRETVEIHRICHNKIHAVFTEKQLAREYDTFDKLLEDEQIRTFVAWVRKKAPDFYSRHDKPVHRRRSR